MYTTNTIEKFDSLITLLNYLNTEQKYIDYLALQRWGNSVSCVHCSHDKVYTLKGKNKRFKCFSCRKKFSVRSGTIFENSKIVLTPWFAAIYLVAFHKERISSLQLMRALDVTQKQLGLC